MPTLDIFNDDAFSMQSLTAAVNNEPFTPGQIGGSGLFEEDGVATTIISVECLDGTLSLVEPSKRGGPGETVGGDKAKLVPFEVPHYERNDAIYADEVQNVRAFGTESTAEQFAARVVRRQNRHLRDLDATLEHQRLGAIQGSITTKSGVVMENLFTKFNIAPADPVSLELDVDATKVSEIVKKDIIWSSGDSLDASYDGVHVFCGRDFYSALWNHPYIRETMLVGSRDAATLRREMPESFEYAGATWERYRAGRKATESVVAAGGAFLDTAKACAVPTGVRELFITRFAPADYIDTVNTEGVPRYMMQMTKPNNKGVDIEVQSNPISLCTQPGVLRALTLT